MRTIKMISVALLLLGQIVSYAQRTLYVDNKLQHISSDYFTTLQAAIDVAKNGDIVLIEASPTTYGSIKINKKAITLVGAGHHPKNQNGLTVLIDNIDFTDTTKNVTFDGLVLNRINPNKALWLRKFTIRNCQINKSIDLGDAASEWLLTSNIFQENSTISSDISDNIANLTFANNFFFKPTIGPLGTNQNVRFANNLFSGSEIGTRTYAFKNFRNVVIENNLFFHINAFEDAQPFNTFVDNYTTECELSMSKDFLTKVNPDFIDYDGGAFAPEYDFRNKNDLTKKAGLYAGAYPFSMTGEPQRLPVIRLLSVDKQSVTANELSFKFKFEANRAKLFSQNPSLYFSSNYIEEFAKVDWKTITEVEYFVDTDPGIGKGGKVTLPATLTDNLSMINLEVFVPKVTPSEKPHTMFLRCKSETGEWSKLQYFSFFIERTDVSMELKALPKPSCVEKEATCFIFTLKNQGTKKIEAQNADLIVYNKKYQSSIATKIPELLPNAETTIAICDATNEILAQDSIRVLLSNDYFNRFDQNKSNQIVALPNVKTEQLVVSVGDNKGISCYGRSDAEAKIYVSKDTSLTANQYEWTLTAADKSVRRFTDIAQIKLKNLAAGWHSIKAISSNKCYGSVEFYVPDAAPLKGILTKVSNYNGKDVSCKDAADGILEATACGGTGRYAYHWANRVFVEDDFRADKLKAGLHIVTIEDARGCLTTVSMSLNEPESIALFAARSNYNEQHVSCAGAADGAITITPTGGLGDFKYQWTHGATTAKITGLSKGTYSVTATDINSCVAFLTIPIVEPAPVAIAKTFTQPLCNALNGALTGTINITPSGGTGAFTYLWNNGATTQNRTGLGKGTYTVTVTDVNGCKLISSTTLTEPPAMGLLVGLTAPSCNVANGALNGAITLNQNGGTGAFTYAWNGGVTTKNRTNLGTGTYAVTATDANGCKISDSYILTEPAAITIAKTSTQPSCNATSGTLNGAINITSSGGTGAFTYDWGAGVTSQNRTSLGSGTYTVTVSDANGCKATNATTLTEPTAVAIAKTSTNPTCNAASGAATGTINITPSGGTGAFTYNWENGVLTPSRMGLGSGTYTVTVTDANGCKATNATTLTEPTAVAIAKTSTNPSCNAASGTLNGAINITSSGGTGAFTYNWGAGVTTQNRTGLGSGTYTVTVTDANGCKATNATTLTEPTAVAIAKTSTNPTCNAASGAATGTINITPSGGTGAFTYNWGAGVTTQNRTGLGSGTYTVTVTDANGCKATNATTLTEPTAVAIAKTSTQPTCNTASGAATGAINITPSGGIGTFTYDWGAGVTTQNRTGLGSGTYTVTVTDANGCKATNATTLTEPTAVAIAKTSTQPTCNTASGAATGTINITPSGGTGTFTYDWGAGVTTQNRTGLGSGTYTVTVTDANGCKATNATTLTEPTAISISKTSTNISCNAGTNGTISIAPSGGTSPYTYNWGGGVTTQNRTGLAASTYTVTVTDANACTATNATTLTQPTAIAIAKTSTNISCNAGTNGTISISPSGGVSPYTYNWGGGVTTQNRTGLAASTYTVTVTDANACTATNTTTLTQPTAISVTTTSTTSCSGGNTGAAMASASGGTGTLAYLWNNGQMTATATALASGTYNVTVSDANACKSTSSVIVSASPSMTISFVTTNVSCNGAANGAITTTVMGGTSPLTYNWGAGITTQNRTGLGVGAYPVTVTDANGCSATNATTITQPTAVYNNVVATYPVTCNGGSNGSVTLNAAGGTGLVTVTPAYTGLAAGLHVFTATDANGCTATTSVTIIQPTALAITKTSTNISCNAGTNGTINITPSGGTGALTYNWGAGVTTQNRTGLGAGTYTVTVTDANFCTATNTTTLTEPAAITITPSVTQPTGPSNGEISIAVTGGTSPYTYDWGAGVTTQNRTGLGAGTYTVTVTDANGCIASSLSTLAAGCATMISKTSTNPTCNGGINGTINITPSGGVSAYTYNWGGGVTTQNRTGVAAGTYVVTVTDANGCTASNTTTLTEPAALAITFTSVQPLCYGQSNGSITANVTGGTGTKNYLWDNGNTTNMLSGIPTSTHSVTVTDANGCNANNSTSLGEPGYLTLQLAGLTLPCYGQNNGSLSVYISSGGTGPYAYLWNSGQTTGTITNLPGATYLVVVTDANGCTTASQHHLTPMDITITPSVTNATCGNSNGAITLAVTGDNAPFTYLWNDGSTNKDRTGLAIGTYTVTVTNSNSNACTKTTSVTITQSAAITITPSVTQPTGPSNGEISIAVVGGTAPYTYDWGGGVTTQNRTGLAVGTYTVTVTDANGCTASSSSTLAAGCGITITKTSTNSCNAGINGTITITPSGGAAPYAYDWGGGITTQNRTGLGAGSYTVTVTDANGCTATNTTTLTESTALVATASGSSSVSSIVSTTGTGTPNLGCTNFTATSRLRRDAIASTCASPKAFPGTSSGNNNNDVYLMTNPSATPVCVTMTLTSTTTRTVHASVHKTPFVPANVVVAGEYIADSGSSSIGSAVPFSFDLAGNQTVAVVLTNPQSNTVNNPYTLTLSTPLLLSSPVIACHGGTKTVTVTGSGGTAPYTGTGTFTVGAGVHNYTVTDANGCSQSTSITVTQPAASLSVTISGATATPAGGTAPYTYLWSNGQTTQTATGLSSGTTYMVTVTDANACTAVASVVASKVAANNSGQIIAKDLIRTPIEMPTEDGTTVNNLHLYPNPTDNMAYFYFENPIVSKIKVHIFDATGRSVEQFNFDKATEYNFSVNKYQSGVYLIKVESEDGQKFVKRLVVQHF